MLAVAIAALAFVVALGSLISVIGPGAASQAPSAPPSATGGSTQAAIVRPASPAPTSTIPGTPVASPEPSAGGADSSPSASIISLAGGGNHPKTQLSLAGGTYRVDYAVSSPPGGSCPWAIYLTDSEGLDLLLASAYPVDETVRDVARDSGIRAGPAAVRVESDCPHWTASVTRLTP